MRRRVALRVFVDACGWDVIERRPWFLPELGFRQPVESVFGYSSACLPAILGGRLPQENDHFCFLRWDPDGSPFRRLPGWLWRLPRTLMHSGRVRRALSGRVASHLGLEGYFSLYDLPLERWVEVDWTEKKDLLRPGGLNRGSSVFDRLAASGVRSHASDWRAPEGLRFRKAERAIEAGAEHVFVYAADLDALRHRAPSDPSAIDAYLRALEARVRRLVASARANGREVDVALFSDHGMSPVRRLRDLRAEVDALGLRWGEDYAAIFDSTMARFWWRSPRGEQRLRDALPDDARGRWLDARTLRAWGACWPDGRFGDAFYALSPGELLCPSDLGASPLAGMHGYAPDHGHSLAVLLGNQAPERPVARLTDLHARILQGVIDVGAEVAA